MLSEPPPQASFVDDEDFWDDLLDFVEHGQVVPIVGEELLTLERDGQTASLYRTLAERLLSRYNVAANGNLREHHELSDAVSLLAAQGKRIKDLYRPAFDALQKLLAETAAIPPSLIELAKIRHFDLFATTTPDGLLARALDDVRFGGAKQTDQIEYAPKLPTDRRRDIPAVLPANYAAVFYLFGKADALPFFAIHDEDALEFPYSLQAGNGPERMFSQLRSRSVLMIGCNFSGWLSRFFLRLSNSERLSSDQRTKKEFLVDQEITCDQNLTTFLRNFSQDSRCCPLPAREFVRELSRRWTERNPPPKPAAESAGVSTAQSPVPSLNGAIFISYSSSDLPAAKQLCGLLEEIGGDVAWFDKSVLHPGDAWESSILGGIQRCSLFVPLISANTEQRSEGYFRREWHEAVERSKRIQGRKFLFPIVIDPDYGGDMARYELVPDEFKAFQYSHAPLGQMNDALRQEFQNQLRMLRRTRAV